MKTGLTGGRLCAVVNIDEKGPGKKADELWLVDPFRVAFAIRA